jgi:hypothetical protein
MGLVPRRPSSKARQATESSLGRFVRDERWNGLSAGDVVRVAGHTARGRHWRFRAYVTNTSNGASWVEVALVEGPLPTRRPPWPEESGRVERIRSFAPELVSPRWRRGRRSAVGDKTEGQQPLF